MPLDFDKTLPTNKNYLKVLFYFIGLLFGQRRVNSTVLCEPYGKYFKSSKQQNSI